jgi:hypothetical protein
MMMVLVVCPQSPRMSRLTAMAVCQRNTTTFDNPPAGEPNEFGETAADMFLNWVYRTQNLGGFINADWRPNIVIPNSTPAAYCNNMVNGCQDTTNPGEARFNWINTRIEDIFTRQGW